LFTLTRVEMWCIVFLFQDLYGCSERYEVTFGRLMVHMRLKTSRGDMGKVGRVLFPRCRSSSSKRGDDYGESIAVYSDVGMCKVLEYTRSTP